MDGYYRELKTIQDVSKNMYRKQCVNYGLNLESHFESLKNPFNHIFCEYKIMSIDH